MNRSAPIAVLAVLLVASLACAFLQKEAAGTEAGIDQTSTGELQTEATKEEPLSPSNPSNPQEVAPTPAGSVCQPERWKVLSRGASVFPYSPGWNAVIVAVAFENGSDNWGALTVSVGKDKAILQTEDGYTYGPEREIDVTFPEASGRVTFRTISFQTRFLPPGFVVAGDSADAGGYYLIPFKVADTQQSFTLTLSGLQVVCAPPGAKLGDAVAEPLAAVTLKMTEGGAIV